MISLGQRTTDSQGRLSILHSGDSSPYEWGFFHREFGAFNVTSGGVAADGRQVLSFDSTSPSGNLVLSFTPSDEGVLPSSAHITPVISEDETRTVLDFAWGMALAVKGRELVVDKLPPGRYMILVTGKAGGGEGQIAVAPEWKQVALIEADQTTSLTFPHTD